MKSRTKQFLQHLSHEIEDEEVGSAYIEDSLPLIGVVVMYFNIVEKNLDRFICEIISDRADSAGLIVIQKLMYNAKLDLFKRFCEEFHQSFGEAPSFNDMMREMGEIGRLRNLVVHADWNSTDEEGYTFVRLNRTKSGLFQEYIQFSVESLEAVIDRIISTDRLLSSYWEWRDDALQPRGATMQGE